MSEGSERTIVSPEVAEIDKDREITVALIRAAEAWAGAETEPHNEDEYEPIKAAAKAYLLAWWQAKPAPGVVTIRPDPFRNLDFRG